MICNSSPLIFLTKINKLELLKELFEKITIPEAVKKEVLVENKEEYNAIKRAIEEGWIVIENPKKYTNLGIGKGENSSLNLAKEKNEALIIDDLRAVKIAKSLNIEFIRTTDILLMALKRDLIKKEEIIKLFNELIKNKYYLSPRLYLEIIRKIESF